MQRVSGGGEQPLMLRLEMRVTGAGITATSTQPSPLGSFADPRCRARLDVTFLVGLSVTPAAGAMLQATALPGEPAARLDGFDWSGENAVCSAFRAAVGALGFEGRIRDAVSRQVSGGASQRLVGALQAALGPVNAQLAAAAPARLSHRQAWATGPQGAQLLALAFSPEAPMPDTTPRATITGRLRVMPARGVVREGGDPPVDCTRLPLQAERKAGPSPILGPNGNLGAPPMEPLSLTISCSPGPDGGLQHRVAGLSAAFPNVLWATGLSHACPQGQRWKSGLVVTLPNRSSQHILPGELSQPIDMDVTPMSAPCNIVHMEERDPRDLPPIDQGLAWRTFEDLAAGRMTLAPQVVDAISRFGSARLRPGLATGGSGLGGLATERGDAVSLNPQPLPPGPDRAAMLEEMLRLQQQQIQLQGRQIQIQQDIMRLAPGR
jgi:hypothetical protein